MKKQGCLWSLVLALVIVMSLAVTAFADETPDGWYQDGSAWYYYQDGSPVTDTVLNLGGTYYAFDNTGVMLDDYADWVDDGYYRARPGGALYVNSWYLDPWDDWYYYGAGGKAPEDFTVVNGAWYFFYPDGMMAEDEAVDSEDYSGWFAISQSGTDSVRLSQAGWNQAFGNWYYMVDGEYGLEPLCDEVLWLGETAYYFDYNGRMAANEIVDIYDPETDSSEEVIAGPSGAIIRDGWVQLNGKWAYVKDYQRIENGLCEIGGNLYIFEDGYMYDLPGEYYYYYDDGEYYVSRSGALYRNQWYYDTTCSSNAVGWRYFGDDGRLVRNQYKTIGGVLYFFDYDSRMRTNEVFTHDGAVYVANAGGACNKVDGWFQHPRDGEWMYATGGELANNFMNIDGTYYAFSEGYMGYSRSYWGEVDGVYGCYLLDANGHIVKTPGWNNSLGRWVYILGDGTMAQGWLDLGGSLYYLNPYMFNNTMFEAWTEEGARFFIADNSGRCTKLTGTGFVTVSDGYNWSWTAYVEDGVPVYDSWKDIDGDRYCFNEYGNMYRNGVYTIDSTQYMFDSNGKLMESGWLRTQSGNTYYAQADGTVSYGKVTIDGKEYLFHNDGRLYSGGMVEYNGVQYYLNSAGQIVEDFSVDGWHQVGQDKYYVKGGTMLTMCLEEIDGETYGFTDDGRMCRGGIMYAWSDYYIFDDNGHVLTGWQMIDGKWYYAEDDEDPTIIIEDGYKVIDGKDYYFVDGALIIGTYISAYEGAIITTDASGVITQYDWLPTGWVYSSEGCVIYKPDTGETYNGWLGDYFISYGRMVFNDVIEYDGKLYYFGPQGLLLRNAWVDNYRHEYYYSENGKLRTKADGSLYCNEWYYSGGVYYYFDSCYMAQGTSVLIDGKWHEFDENGKWLGEEQYNIDVTLGLADGWHYRNGSWYFYHAGMPLYYGTYYINGAYYAFDYQGRMVTNAVYEGHYYTAGGGRLNATGWQSLNGQWYYFGADYSVQTGWVWDGNAWYYIEKNYKEDDYFGDTYTCRMLANQYFFSYEDSYKLYYLNASGAASAPITADGWYLSNRGWHYIDGGALIQDGYHKIGDTGYCFASGVMRANAVCSMYMHDSRGYYMLGYRYFDASGAEVTAPGWYVVNGKWIYVTAGGELLCDGIYQIGGTYYSFASAYWVG